MKVSRKFAVVSIALISAMLFAVGASAAQLRRAAPSAMTCSTQCMSSNDCTLPSCSLCLTPGGGSCPQGEDDCTCGNIE